jgi:hypothetical protein
LHNSRAEIIKLKTELEDAVCQNASLKAELTELREAAAWYVEADEFNYYIKEYAVKPPFMVRVCAGVTKKRAKSALRALLNPKK